MVGYQRLGTSLFAIAFVAGKKTWLPSPAAGMDRLTTFAFLFFLQ